MAKIIFRKFDKLVNFLSLLFFICSGMFIHTLTALTLSNYYGGFWGYVSFCLPVVAEAYLLFVQLGDNMYNYSILLATFAVMTLAMTLLLLGKNLVRAKMESILEKRAPQQ